ncbi:MAG: putative nitrogen fixation protein NifT [Pseudomonadales bacterium]|nr:putative nitrogen fixation protein NifT [Pseudomonadales bacterium]
MPSVMIRRNKQGQLTLYVAKKDLEANVVTMEFDAPDRWGGELKLEDGTAYFIEPLSAPPGLPITLRAKRAGES